MNYQELDFPDIRVELFQVYPYDLVGQNTIASIDVQGYRYATFVLVNNNTNLRTLFPVQREQLLKGVNPDSYPINYFQIYDYRDPGLSLNKLGAPYRYREGATNPETLGNANGTNGNVSIQTYVLDGTSIFAWVAAHASSSTTRSINRLYCLLKSRYTGSTARVNVTANSPTNEVWIDCRAYHWAGLNLFFNGAVSTFLMEGYVYRTQPLAVRIDQTTTGESDSNPMRYIQGLALTPVIAYRINCQSFGWIKITWTGAPTSLTVKGLLQG